MNKRTHVRRAFVRAVDNVYKTTTSNIQFHEISSFFKKLKKDELLVFSLFAGEGRLYVHETEVWGHPSEYLPKMEVMLCQNISINPLSDQLSGLPVEPISDQTITEVVNVIMDHLTLEAVTRRFNNEREAESVIDS